MTRTPFGNDRAKIARYRTFWNREDVRRPLVGFSFVGWFPLQEFAACKTWGSADYLTPDMVDPGAFIEDHIRMLREGEKTDDDLIRGACPGQVAVPWLPGMLGCKLRILPQNAMGEERHLPWDEALQLRLDHNDAWFRKYMEFAEALAAALKSSWAASGSRNGSDYYQTFTVVNTLVSPHVVGSFHATGGTGNDIQVVVAEKGEFENWINGHQAHVLYSSGKTTNGRVDVPITEPGTYCLGFSNAFSLVSAKNIAADIELQYLMR